MLVSETGPEKLRFKPRARIIRTIGDQLISGPEAAVIELVKNAYDADARRVVVTFLPPLEQGYGRITVSDDGHGMALGDIQDKWMEPATTSKMYGRRSPVLGRVMMGSKGIGRFAAAKLGGYLGLISITDRESSRHAVLIPQIDWSLFNGDTYLSDIAIDYFTEDSDQPTGTLLEITQLSETWSEAKVRRLLLELRKLVSPLRDGDSSDSFSIFLNVSGCTVENCGFDGALMMGVTGESSADDNGSPDLRYQVQPVPLMTACDYEITGEFDESGQFSGTFENKRAGTSSETLELLLPLQPDEDPCGPVGVRLFLFDREAEAIKTNLRNAGLGEMTAAKARQLLDSITGVAIYREGFRVRPYGDPENDWLTLDRERVNDPSLRIGHNQVAGYVAVADRETSHLEERSSREGFESNGAFRRLTRLIRELLAREVEPRRYQFRQRAGLSRSRNSSFDDVRKLGELGSVRRITASLPEAERAKADQIINQQSHLISERIDLLEERQRRLEANSALGAIIAEIIHEGIQPAAYTATTSQRLKRLFPDMLLTRGNRFDYAKGEFETKLPLLADAGAKLVDLFENLEPLTAGRRSQPESFNVNNIIKGAMALFENSGVPMTIINPDRISNVFGHAGDLQTALVNLFKNAIHWLRDAQTPDPNITVTLSADGNSVVAAVEDNGPGIRAEFADSIFDVGFSLRSRGTGLGLNIAREALARSKAVLELDTDRQPGTRFVITFPRTKEN